MAGEPTIIDLMGGVFAAFFRPLASWSAWAVLLKALFALPMTAEERATFEALTHRATPPSAPVREAWWIVGRRGGKSRIACLLVVLKAFFVDYTGLLAPGERGTVMLTAPDRRQARTDFRYVVGLIDAVPALAAMVTRRTRDALDLSNGITIEIHTASFRTIRGYTVVAAICDELAFWRSEESANPDVEIIAALRPGMATVPGALLLCITSPYARRGATWEAYSRHYGRAGDVLVVQAPTLALNPTVDPAVIAAAYEADEASAAAEYGAEFRRDVDGYVSREWVEPRVVRGRAEVPPVGRLPYVAFVDPSGGAQDSMTLAIAHSEDGRRVLDLVRERRPPFSPEDVVQEFAECLQRYRVTRVTGDRYGGEWPRERFQVHGIVYEVADRAKSDLYREALPLFTSGQVDLLDHPRLMAQLLGLERRTARGGRDSIDHAPGGHDDLINAAAGALLLAGRDADDLGISIGSWDGSRHTLAAAGEALDAGDRGREVMRVSSPWDAPAGTLGRLARGGGGW